MNKPISTVVEELKTATGHKLGRLRCEIDSRFKAQDWDVQLQILATMLQHDDEKSRKWVFDTLTKYFWKELGKTKGKQVAEIKTQILAQTTRHLKERSVAFFAIEWMPLSFVKANSRVLEKSCSYFEVAWRLAQDSSYEVDYEKTGLFGYYSIMVKYGRTCDEQEARWRLANWITQRPRLTEAMRVRDCLRLYGIYPSKRTFSYYNVEEVDYLMHTFTKLGLHALVERFNRFNRILSAIVMKKYMADKGEDAWDDSEEGRKYIELMHSLAKRAIQASINPDEALKKMLQNNYPLVELKVALGLQPISEPPF